MERCKYCKRLVKISPEGRQRIREFRQEYPWVTQKSLATLFNITQARMSEIIRRRGGD